MGSFVLPCCLGIGLDAGATVGSLGDGGTGSVSCAATAIVGGVGVGSAVEVVVSVGLAAVYGARLPESDDGRVGRAVSVVASRYVAPVSALAADVAAVAGAGAGRGRSAGRAVASEEQAADATVKAAGSRGRAGERRVAAAGVGDAGRVRWVRAARFLGVVGAAFSASPPVAVWGAYHAARSVGRVAIGAFARKEGAV